MKSIIYIPCSSCAQEERESYTLYKLPTALSALSRARASGYKLSAACMCPVCICAHICLRLPRLHEISAINNNVISRARAFPLRNFQEELLYTTVRRVDTWLACVRDYIRAKRFSVAFDTRCALVCLEEIIYSKYTRYVVVTYCREFSNENMYVCMIFQV